MGSQGDGDNDKKAKNGVTVKEGTADKEAAAAAATDKPAVTGSSGNSDKDTAGEGNAASSSAPADSKKRKERSEEDSTPSSKTKNCKPTPAAASENPAAAKSNDASATQPAPAPASHQPRKDVKFPVQIPTPLQPPPVIRSQHLAEKTLDDMPPEIRKVFLEIKSDPRWKFAFFPCGALMNLVRANQTDLLDLFERHFPSYCDNNSKGRGKQTLSELVQDTILPLQPSWYMYADGNFTLLSPQEATKKILQKFRTMRKQRKTGTGTTEHRKRAKSNKDAQAAMDFAVEATSGAGYTSDHSTPEQGKRAVV